MGRYKFVLRRMKPSVSPFKQGVTVLTDVLEFSSTIKVEIKEKRRIDIGDKKV